MRTMWNNNYIVMDLAVGGDGGGSGAPGAGSFFTPPPGGGKATPPAGGAGTPPNPDPNQPAGNPNPNTPPKGDPTADWKSALPKELQEDATLAKFQSVPALAGSYLALQKLMGKDKMPVPGDHFTDEQWAEHYKKSGLPETLEKYELKAQEGFSLDKTFLDQYKEKAHAAGILPRQAQKVLDWFAEENIKSEGLLVAERNRLFVEGQKKLKTEWGNAYDTKIARSIKLLEDHGGADLINYFNASGLGGDEKFIRFAAALGDKLYAEHKVVGEGGTGSVRTPKEIQEEITKVQGDKTHPYNVKDHPGHKAALEMVSSLYKELYPSVDKK